MQESSSNPEKYFGNRKKCDVVLAQQSASVRGFSVDFSRYLPCPIHIRIDSLVVVRLILETKFVLKSAQKFQKHH